MNEGLMGGVRSADTVVQSDAIFLGVGVTLFLLVVVIVWVENRVRG